VKYDVEMGSGAMMYVPSLVKIGKSLFNISLGKWFSLRYIGVIKKLHVTANRKFLANYELCPLHCLVLWGEVRLNPPSTSVTN
jgi:hypothetical protein